MKYDKNFETVMDYVFKSEGGFRDSKNDLGGRTDKGVTQTTYDLWRKKKGLAPKDVKGISNEEAKQLYYEEFWLPTGASKIKDLHTDFSKYKENELQNIRNKYLYLKNKNGISTGQAAPVDINQLLNFDDINNQLEQLKQQIPQKKSGLAGYTNPLTGNNRIFTREDVDAMSNDEFSKYEKEIDAQTKAFNGTMPTNGDL